MQFKIVNFYHHDKSGITPTDNFGRKLGPWYIISKEKPTSFLHSDVSVQRCAIHSQTGEFSGWYATREDARKALRAYKVANAT